MRKVEVNISKANLKLSQIEFDALVNNKTTINLSSRKTTKQIKETRRNRIQFNTARKVLKWLVIPFIAFMVLVIGIWITNDTNAYNWEHDRFLAHFPLETRVIGCYNNYTKETREDYICTKPWDLNIKLPARSQIVTWFKYYNEYQIMNRLALVNFESSFNIHASNPYAKWYIQTLRSYNISIDIDTQLQWLKNRENRTYWKVYYAGKWGKTRWCGYYWNNFNTKDNVEAWEYWVLSCMYRYHYQANTWMWYGARGIKVTKFYKYYMFWIK